MRVLAALFRHPSGRIGAVIIALYLVVAVTVVGLPPLAGFLGKVSILQGAGAMPWFCSVVLGTSLLNLIALVRAGTRLFWSTSAEPCDGLPAAASMRRLAPVALLAAAIVGLTVFAGPVQRYANEAAHHVVTTGGYVEKVLGAAGLRWSIVIEPAPPEGRQP